MLTALGPLRLGSSGAHCARTLAVEVQRCSLRSPAGEEDWREAWRRGLAAHLAKWIGEALGEEEEEEKKNKKEDEL